MNQMGGEIQKSYFDVLGICCPSEVPLIEKILNPIDGVEKVSVIVTSKTVIVEHDPSLIDQLQIVKLLNQASLEASIRVYGSGKIIKKWPSFYIMACGVFLSISLFQKLFNPLKWFAVVAVAFGLYPIAVRSFAAIRKLTLDINILMLIAVGGALALRDYTEAGSIVFLFTIAEWLETRACHKATDGMTALMSMTPQKAILAETGEVVDAKDVKVNTILAVKAGEVIPIDGIVVEGRSEVNEQSLTGESFPVPKQIDSLVWAGTLNIDGYISVKTTAIAENSAVAKMARLVEEAQNNRSKTQRLIDSCAKYYTPGAVVIAVGVAVIPLILHVHNPKHWLQLALVLLVSACPCALVLSTPVATFCSLLTAARLGLIVKGGDVLEALAKTKVVAFDKTGTITRGEFKVMELRPVGTQVTMSSLVYWISSIESKSSHPMASALIEHARSKSIEPKPDNVREFQIIPGEGVYGEIDNKKIYIGNKRIALRAGCNAVPHQHGEDSKEAVTRGYVFSNATLIGTFSLSDSCRTGVAEAIGELKSLGIKVAMLTGDSNAAATHANNQLDKIIEMVHAELLPEDKVRIIMELKTKYGSTAMVGDGMNDAPALAAANVGISMGVSGSAVAMETSHVTLMSNDIMKIAKAIKLARKTNQKIIGNIIFSIITKIGILALAIAGHPILWAAVLADVGTCLIVILNSMTLLHTKTPKVKTCSSHNTHAHNHHHGKHEHKNCSDHAHEHAHEDHVHCHGVLHSNDANGEQKAECNGHHHHHHHHVDDAHDHQPNLVDSLGEDNHVHHHHHHVDDAHDHQPNLVDSLGEYNHVHHHGHDAHDHCVEEHHCEKEHNEEKHKHDHCHDAHIHCDEERHDEHDHKHHAVSSVPEHVINIKTEETGSYGIVEDHIRSDVQMQCNRLMENEAIRSCCGVEKKICCSSARCGLRRREVYKCCRREIHCSPGRIRLTEIATE